MIGTLSSEMADMVLETIPLEISIVDEHDEVVAWNRHDTRLFKRPKGVVGRNVRDCHPKKSLHMVERILDEMKKGGRDSARFWIDLPDGSGAMRKILIEYYALRAPDGSYCGCMESTRDITDIVGLSGQNRLLD